MQLHAVLFTLLALHCLPLPLLLGACQLRLPRLKLRQDPGQDTLLLLLVLLALLLQLMRLLLARLVLVLARLVLVLARLVRHAQLSTSTMGSLLHRWYKPEPLAPRRLWLLLLPLLFQRHQRLLLFHQPLRCSLEACRSLQTRKAAALWGQEIAPTALCCQLHYCKQQEKTQTNHWQPGRRASHLPQLAAAHLTAAPPLLDGQAIVLGRRRCNSIHRLPCSMGATGRGAKRHAVTPREEANCQKQRCWPACSC
jgi:hypothetical protein